MMSYYERCLAKLVEMEHIPATAAGMWAFSRAANFLSDEATKHLKKTDVGNNVIRRRAIGELLEVRDSLSTLSHKELETARFQLENGLILSQQEFTVHAASEFEAARRNSELAFSVVPDLEAKIEATKMAVMAVLYQYDEDLAIAYTLCMQYLRRLHDLPELKETIRVHMYEATPLTLSEATEWLIHLYWMPRGLAWPIIRDLGRVYRSVKDWVTQTDRKSIFESVCRLNLILSVFFLKNKILEDLCEWPSISIPEHDPIHPLEHILSFDRSNQHDIRPGQPPWELEILDDVDECHIVCLWQRTKSPIEITWLDIRDMSESRLLRLTYMPCVLYAVNGNWIVVVGQREGMCLISVLNRVSWRFDREKEIAYQLNNNDQLVRVLKVSINNNTLFLLQRNGSITQIDLNTMAIIKTASLHLKKHGPHPYAEGLNFDEPLDEYEVEFLQRTDKIRLAKEQTAMDDSKVILGRGCISVYDIRNGSELQKCRSDELESGLDGLLSLTEGYICAMYIRSEDDKDILADRSAGCDLEIRTRNTLEVIAKRRMPYFRQARHLVACQEGDFLSVISSRTLSLWELNSGTLIAEYTFTTLEPVSVRWVNARFLFVTFSGGVVSRYEIMS